MAKFLKDNDIVAVPFDKGTAFCVMKTQWYHKKLADIALKIEKDINSTLLDMKKSSLLREFLSKNAFNRSTTRETLSPSKSSQEWNSFTPMEFLYAQSIPEFQVMCFIRAAVVALSKWCIFLELALFTTPWKKYPRQTTTSRSHHKVWLQPASSSER